MAAEAERQQEWMKKCMEQQRKMKGTSSGSLGLVYKCRWDPILKIITGMLPTLTLMQLSVNVVTGDCLSSVREKITKSKKNSHR